MYAPQGQNIVNTKGTHCQFGIAGNLGVVLAWLTECVHAATHKWGGHMDEDGNSLHFISSAVHFLYKNFPKKSIFSTTTLQKNRFSLHKLPKKKAIFWEKIQKNRSPKSRVGTPGGGGRARRADPPTLADPAIPKTAIICKEKTGKIRPKTTFFHDKCLTPIVVVRTWGGPLLEAILSSSPF